ncbi:MAG: FAD-dependent oxidoreductase [Betaproteobacteria bacterium]|nr:FAD-dependent oxidoreductase [Betaproteobacteria bacterium]
MAHWTEPARQLPVYGSFDVVVVGGGPAGIAASWSAAKHGAKVLLIERYGFLGGMGTAGGVTNFAGLYGIRQGHMQQVVHGVVDEIFDRLSALDGLNDPQDGMQGRIRVRSYDMSAYKCVADQMLRDVGVEILFHAWAAQVHAEDGRIQALFVETKSGRQTVLASSFIDCSGDADVAAFAGVPFEVGDGLGSGLYPTTMFRIAHVNSAQALAAVGEFQAINLLMKKVQAEKPGHYQFPREGAILRPQKNPSEWRANVTQIAQANGMAMDATDARQLSQGELEGRQQVGEFFRFLKNEVPGFAKAQITEIAPQVGIRESRRIQGMYALTGHDIVSCATFEDAIGVNAWPMEMHAQGKIEWRFPEKPVGPHQRLYNHLPWRMLVPQGVHNLLVAGRCASMTHEGQSAARVSGGCFVMGQAAGTAAAHLSHGQRFSDTSVNVLQQRLVSDGCFLELEQIS